MPYTECSKNAPTRPYLLADAIADRSSPNPTLKIDLKVIGINGRRKGRHGKV
jgi:hypothetical protein